MGVCAGGLSGPFAAGACQSESERRGVVRIHVTRACPPHQSPSFPLPEPCCRAPGRALSCSVGSVLSALTVYRKVWTERVTWPSQLWMFHLVAVSNQAAGGRTISACPNVRARTQVGAVRQRSVGPARPVRRRVAESRSVSRRSSYSPGGPSRRLSATSDVRMTGRAVGRRIKARITHGTVTLGSLVPGFRRPPGQRVLAERDRNYGQSVHALSPRHT